MRLRGKLLLVLLPVVLAGLTLQWMVSSYSQERQMTGQRAALLADLLDNAALRMIDQRHGVLATYGLESLELYVARYQAAVLEELADLAARANVVLIVQDAQGRILSPSSLDSGDLLPGDRLMLEALRADSNDHLILDIDGWPHLAVVRQFDDWGWTVAAAYPSASIEDAIQSVNLAISVSLGIVGLAIALTLFVGVDRLVISPVRQLEEKLRAFADGRQLADMRLGGADEIGELAGKIDAIAHGIVTHTAELERSNSELDGFAQTVGHQLRKPLRAIDTIVGWLAADAGPLPDAALDHLSRLRDQVARMDSMLEDLLHYAEASQVTGPLGRCDVRALVAEQLAILAPVPEVRLEVVGDPPILISPEPPLALVLRNLIGNAIEHHDRDVVTLEIRVTQQDRRVVFRLSDDGPGIAPGQLGRLFTVFDNRRADSGHAKNEGGIGLALVRRIVQRLGGTMTVESEAGRRGTTIVFDWPIDCTLLPTLAGPGLPTPTSATRRTSAAAT